LQHRRCSAGDVDLRTHRWQYICSEYFDTKRVGYRCARCGATHTVSGIHISVEGQQLDDMLKQLKKEISHPDFFPQDCDVAVCQHIHES
jgi:DNA-directed RNA polymerase subunit RPC12/RpoP